MEFGVQFFPNVTPEEKSAAQYFEECLGLCDILDECGYNHVRIVEHYFHTYGGRHRCGNNVQQCEHDCNRTHPICRITQDIPRNTAPPTSLRASHWGKTEHQTPYWISTYLNYCRQTGT